MGKQAPYSGGTRAQDGVTVFASSDDGERRHFSITHLPIRDALRLICRELDALPGRWFVDVISSPSTIWRDLQGMREERGKQEKGRQLLLPEAQYLGQIGRLDLWRAGTHA